MDKSCDSPGHETRGREAVKAFCELAAYFVGLASHDAAHASAHADAVSLLAYENMLQLLSVVRDEEFRVAPVFRLLAEDARVFVAERNQLLSESFWRIEALAGRLGTRITATRGSRFMVFYPGGGLRYMKDLDIGVMPGDDPATLMEAMMQEGWTSLAVEPGDSPMLVRRVPGRVARAGPGRLFPDIIEGEGDEVETVLYVEFNPQETASDGAPEGVKESAAREAFRLAQAEFDASAPNLKHLLDAMLAAVWVESPCCGGGAQMSGSVEAVQEILRPLGIIADGGGCRFDPRTASSGNRFYRCFADVVAGSPYRSWASSL